MVGPTDLLATWESGLAAGPLQRALLLHELTGAHADELLTVPVGRRDADLLGLRRALFGERLQARLACPQCRQEMEFDVDIEDLVGMDAPVTDPALAPGQVEVSVGSWRVRLRLPTPGDLLEISQDGPANQVREALLARCVAAAEHAGQPVDAGALPEELVRQAVAALADADPCADIRLTIVCVQCSHRATSALDVTGYLWAELDAWARATLMDVHLLATSYGWSETEILAVSPTRRRYYLELAGHA